MRVKTERKDRKGCFISSILSFSREFFCEGQQEFGQRTWGCHLSSRTLFFRQNRS